MAEDGGSAIQLRILSVSLPMDCMWYQSEPCSGCAARSTWCRSLSTFMSVPQSKEKIDADSLNRSEIIERDLRDEHLRIALQNYTTRTVAALNIDSYAKQVNQANRAAGL